MVEIIRVDPIAARSSNPTNYCIVKTSGGWSIYDSLTNFCVQGELKKVKVCIIKSNSSTHKSLDRSQILLMKNMYLYEVANGNKIGHSRVMFPF